MTERGESFKKTFSIRSEHENLLRRFDAPSKDGKEPIVYVAQGSHEKELDVYIDIPALSLNHNDATSIETLEELLMDPQKVWRGPQYREDL